MLQSRTRVENRARWQKAAERAVTEGIEIRQLQSTGQWVATSGTDKTLAYQVEVTGAVAHSCDCLAGLNGDGVCKHRAAYYLLVGALSATPEPEPPAPAEVEFIQQNADRHDVYIGGEFYGDAVAIEYGGWALFQGRFPQARRIGNYCTLDEIARSLRAGPEVIPFPAAEPERIAA